MSVVHRTVWPIWISAAGREVGDVEHFDGMRVSDVIPARYAACNLRVLVNGSVVDDREAELEPNDQVDVAVRPTGPFLPALTGIFTAGLSGGLAAGAAAGLAAFAKTAILLGFAGSFLSFLIGRQRGPRSRGDEESLSYGFSGPANGNVEGLPKQVYYGQTREPGQVLDSFTVSRTNPPETDLYYIIGFGEGSVERIGDQTVDTDPDFPLSTEDASHPILKGVQLNGNNLENFRRVEAHVRLGTNTQKPIPGFDSLFTDYSVGAVLDQEQVASPGSGSISNGLLNPDLDLSSVAYNSNSADAQALWDEHGFSYDLTSRADSWKSIIAFERGLYGISATTGAVTDAGFQMLTRYMRLDDSGTAITAGGDNGDGWVYVFPKPIYVAREQRQFTLEFGGTFSDPATWTAPTQGKYLDCSAVSSYAVTPVTGSMAGVPAQFANGATITDFTVEGWFKFNTLDEVGSTTYRAMFEWGDATTSRGFAFGLESTNSTFGGGGTISYWLPTLWLGIGSGSSGTKIGPTGTLSSIGIRGQYTSETPWFHLAVTYTRTGGASGQSRTRFYINGSLVSERLTSPITGLGTAGTLNIFRSLRLMTGSTFTTRGKADEVLVYTSELTAENIEDRYNGGYGTPASSSTANLFEGWHMDVATNPGTYTITAGFSTNGATNTLTVTNGTVGAPTTFGVVFTTGAGSPLRSRYRVQHLRLNLRSTSSAIQDEATWAYLYGKIDARLSYPNTPILALKITATDQLNSSAPTVTTDGRWRKVNVWDGSAFIEQWSSNPAWVVLDILTNTRYGRAWPMADIDITSFKEWADYCDGFVYDGRGNVQDIDESGSSAPIYELFFDATKFSGYGGFAIYFRSGFVYPASWVVGAFVGLLGLPVDGTVVVDVNVGGGVSDAWEIGSIEGDLSSGFQVWLRYDYATLGDPWGAAGSYTLAATTALTGTARGYERRFSYDGGFDTFKPSWDAIREVCNTARAVPIKEGARIRIKYERPREPVGIITHASISEGSFTIQYNDRLDAANVVSIDIRDRDKNYVRSPVEVFDPELEESALEEELERDPIRLDGVVRRSQAIRHGLFIVSANRLLTKSISFETGAEALPYEVGDVLRVAHDIMPWGDSGRIATGSTTTEVVLDRDVTLAPATTYFIAIRANALGVVGSGSSASDHLEFVEVLEAAGTYAAGVSITVDTMTIAPSKDDPYILCAEGNEFLCQIVEIRARDDHSRTIDAIKHDNAIYDVDTLPVDLPL